jgi:hypothetical protein
MSLSQEWASHLRGWICHLGELSLSCSALLCLLSHPFHDALMMTKQEGPHQMGSSVLDFLASRTVSHINFLIYYPVGGILL